MNAACSDMPRFWARPVGTSFAIHDRNRADKLIAHLDAQLRPSWHEAGYCDLAFSNAWKVAAKEARPCAS